MILVKRLVKRVFNSYYDAVEQFMEKPFKVQEENFKYLLERGKKTYIGQEHGFDRIKGISDFQKKVPVTKYEDLRPYLDKIILEQQQNVLWDTPVKWFAMSSGTTNDKSKYIPVTEESLQNCHYRSGYHMLALYAHSYPDAAYVFGKTLVLGGSQQVNNIGGDVFTGDISAILMKNVPFWVKFARTPEDLALIPDWDEKLEKLSAYAIKQDIRAFVGVPSWMLVLLKKITKDTGKRIDELWKNLEVFFHGGVNFAPYEAQYNKLIQSPRMRYWETYNASEGFFGVQYNEESKDMLLLLDNEIFYEFIPVDELNNGNYRDVPALTLSEVEVGQQYAMLITTSGGLWRYKIGDTIMFTSLTPHLFRITGRTKQFINAFGEELIVDNADKALQRACEETHSKIIEYTAAPIYFNDSDSGAHEWFIEFEEHPDNMDVFGHLLDKYLKEVNSDYEAKRSNNLSLAMPVIHVVEDGMFYEWMEHRKKAGGQNKIPKLSNDRKFVEDILQFMETKS